MMQSKKYILTLTTLYAINSYMYGAHAAPHDLSTIIQIKKQFLEQHDKEKLIPKMIEVLQNIKSGSESKQKNLLERELAILTSQYYNQLSKEQVQELRTIVEKFHTARKEVATLPSNKQGQDNVFEVLFM